MKNLLVLILASFIPLSVFSQVGEILYQFPKPGSSHLKPESSVLIKVNSPEFAKAVGRHEHLIVANENGKKITGKYTIARDGKNHYLQTGSGIYVRRKGISIRSG